MPRLISQFLTKTVTPPEPRIAVLFFGLQKLKLTYPGRKFSNSLFETPQVSQRPIISKFKQ